MEGPPLKIKKVQLLCIQLLVWPTFLCVCPCRVYSWCSLDTVRDGVGSTRRMQRSYCIETSGHQFIPELLLFFFLAALSHLSLILWLAIIKDRASGACVCVCATSPLRLLRLPLPSFLFLLLSFFVFLERNPTSPPTPAILSLQPWETI